MSSSQVTVWFLFLILWTVASEHVYNKPVHDANSKFQADFIAQFGEKPKLNDYLMKFIDRFRNEMKDGIPSLGIPVLDPLYVGDVSQQYDDMFKNEASIDLTNITIEGISQFQIQYLESSFKNLRLEAKVYIPTLTVNSYFNVFGKTIILLKYTESGEISMKVTDVVLTLKTSLSNDSVGNLQVMNDFNLTYAFKSLKVNYIKTKDGKSVNWLTRTSIEFVTKKLFNIFYPKLQKTTNQIAKEVINDALQKIPIKDIKPGRQLDEYVDTIMDLVKGDLINQDLSEIALPDFETSYSKDIVVYTLEAYLKIYNGNLRGLDTIHRSRSCSLNYTLDYILLNIPLALHNISLYYEGFIETSLASINITIAGRLDYIDLDAKVLQKLEKGSTLELLNLDVSYMSEMNVEITGLGALTWLLTYILNTMETTMKSYVSDAIENDLRKIISQEFGKVAFPF